MNHTILAINPGSTSTKIAVFDDRTLRFETNIKHSADELSIFATIADQFSFRRQVIINELKQRNVALDSLTAIVGRGGLLRPIPSGVYRVDDAMVADLINPIMGQHASNLGGLIARDLAHSISDKVPAYIADPVVVDELQPIARITGHPLFERRSIFHALNQKAIARRFAIENNLKYEDLNLIVVHLGGGISVGSHQKGRVVDVNNALDGEGGFSPERSGTLPSWQLVQLCFSGKYTQQQLKTMITGEGGFVAHLGTNDALDVENRALAGEEPNKAIFDAMCYNIGKMIGSSAAVLHGDVDAILITGGMARSKYMVNYLRSMTSKFAPRFEVYPGEDEMSALAFNALMAINGEVKVLSY